MIGEIQGHSVAPASHQQETVAGSIAAAQPAAAANLCWSTAITALTVLVAWGVVGIRYGTNDDVIMRLLTEGRLVPGSEPSPFTLFLNIMLGAPLAELYRRMPSVPWYDSLLAGTTIVGTVALLYALMFRRSTDRIVALAFALTLLVPVLARPQFTTVAGVTSAAGLVLLVRALFWSGPGRAQTVETVVAVALLGWATLFRLESAITVILLGTMIVLPLIIAQPEPSPRRTLSRLLPPLGAFVLIAAAGQAIDKQAYHSSPEWRDAQEYNLQRVALTYEFRPDERAIAFSDVRQAGGWSSVDWAMFEGWFGVDTDVFGIEHTRRAFDAKQAALRQSAPIWLQSLLNLEQNQATVTRLLRVNGALLGVFVLLGAAWHDRGVSSKVLLLQLVGIIAVGLFVNDATLALLAMAIFALGRRAAPALVHTLFASVCLVGVVCLIAVLFRYPPPRVLLPLMVLTASLICVRIAYLSLSPRIPMALLCVAATLYVIIPQTMRLATESRTHAANRERLHQAFDEIPDVENLVIFNYALSEFPVEVFWAPFVTEASNVTLVLLGWQNQTPVLQKYLRETGRSHLPYALCTEPQLRLLSAARIVHVLEAYVRERHGLSARLERAVGDSPLPLAQCVLTDQPADARISAGQASEELDPLEEPRNIDSDRGVSQ